MANGTNGGKGNPYSGNSANLVKKQVSDSKPKGTVVIHKGKDLRSK